MKSNRTSSFPAVMKTTTAHVLISAVMTAMTLGLAIAAFARGHDLGGWTLTVLTVGQLFLLSVNVVAKHHIDKKNEPDAGT